MNEKSIHRLIIISTVLLVALAIYVSACASTQNPSPANPQAAETHVKSGSQLWAENCMRCHNTRSPATYNNGEWEVAMQHMRIRANLTEEEQQKIEQFLKAGN